MFYDSLCLLCRLKLVSVLQAALFWRNFRLVCGCRIIVVGLYGLGLIDSLLGIFFGFWWVRAGGSWTSLVFGRLRGWSRNGEGVLLVACLRLSGRCSIEQYIHLTVSPFVIKLCSFSHPQNYPLCIVHHFSYNCPLPHCRPLPNISSIAISSWAHAINM